MEGDGKGQYQSGGLPPLIGRRDLIIPNPKLKLLDQVREVMRLKHYSIRTETAYCDWIRRYIVLAVVRQRVAAAGGFAAAGAGCGLRHEATDGARWEGVKRPLHDAAREGHAPRRFGHQEPTGLLVSG